MSPNYEMDVHMATLLEVRLETCVEGLITPTTSSIISQHANSMKSGGSTSISQHNPQQLHSRNRTETLV
jgi:hypothetical protein